MELTVYNYKITFKVEKIVNEANPEANSGSDNFVPVPYEAPHKSALEERIRMDEMERLGKIADEPTDPEVADLPKEKTIDGSRNVQPETDVPKIMEECSELITEFESYKSRFETEEGKTMAETIQNRLTELLTKYGAQLIIGDKEFDVLRHTAVPAQYVDDGTPIREFIRPGIIMGKKVLIRAQVNVGDKQ